MVDDVEPLDGRSIDCSGVRHAPTIAPRVDERIGEIPYSTKEVAAASPLVAVAVRPATRWRSTAGTVHAPCSDAPAPRHECCSPVCWRSRSRAARSRRSSRSISEVTPRGAVPASVIVWPLARETGAVGLAG